ncbi:hypothetical protein A9Q84_01840 [Halobacteriovorax marinus]|uniref:N-acetyltransferase domain-containing protein n=1 Tax=Halobacteriovorax marinus TaxID=97084 RepID=A0A1Y5FHY0_9BACT|nr:hypothetical protein A9Q84_01840 [Halobacteriovorax marinus]
MHNSKLEVEIVGSEEFFETFKEDRDREFADFLHPGNMVFYTEAEKENSKAVNHEPDDKNNIYMVIRDKGEIIARSFSFQELRRSLLMAMSFVNEDYRGQGLYKLMMDASVKFAKERGYLKITSFHNSTNNKIIIPKLKYGFTITGMRLDAGYGTLIELTYFISEKEREAVDFRCGYKRPSKDLLSRMGIN